MVVLCFFRDQNLFILTILSTDYPNSHYQCSTHHDFNAH